MNARGSYAFRWFIFATGMVAATRRERCCTAINIAAMQMPNQQTNSMMLTVGAPQLETLADTVGRTASTGEATSGLLAPLSA